MLWSLALVLAIVGTPAAKGKPAADKKPAAERKVDKKGDKRPSWVVLWHTQTDVVPAAWNAKLRAAAEADKSLTWVAPPAMALEDVQLALGCIEWGPPCAAQIAGTTGAQNALVVSVTGNKETPHLTVQKVKGDGSVLGDAEEIDLPDASLDGLRVAEAFVRGIVKGSRPTILVVNTDVPGADVVIDGDPRGKTPLTLLDVAPGEHELLLRMEGRAPLVRHIVVEGGQLHREDGVLSANGPPRKSEPVVGTPLAPAKPLPAGTMAAVAGWSLTGVGVGVAAVGAAIASLALRDWNSMLTDPQPGLERGYRTDLCTRLNGDVVGGDLCSGESSPIAPKDRVKEELDAIGQSYSGRITTSLITAGAGLLVAGTGAALALTLGAGEEADATAQPPPTTTPVALAPLQADGPARSSSAMR